MSQTKSLPTPYAEWPGVGVLYCGDAREIVPQIESGSIDFVFTDPPYGHNNNNGDLIHRWEAALGRLPCGSDSPLESRPIANDGAEANPLIQWFFSEADRLLSPGCCCCCGGGGPDPQFARWSIWMDEAIGFKQMVVWDKGPMGMGWHYRRSYETVLVGEKPGAACRWFDETDSIENVIRPYTLGIRKIIPNKKQHPTPKPPELAEHFIGLHSRRGELVLEPFAGGGSTLVACVKLERRFIACEVCEEFCEMTKEAVDRELSQPRLPFIEPVKETQAEMFS